MNDPSDLVFDWCRHGPHRFRSRPVEVNDETLRDGLQSPSVRDPSLDEKVRIVHLLDALGVECASMGIPAAGDRQLEHVTALCKEIADRDLSLRPNCGGRTVVADVEKIVEVVQRSGSPVEACLFLGSSPIRQFVEGWDLDRLLSQTRDAIEVAVREGLEVMFITEDTTRSRPEHLEALFGTAVESGAKRVCLCDTVGSATPHGVRNLVGWARCVLDEFGPGIGIDWHGHRDRGLGLANTLAAIEAGATRVHGTVHGVGERVGNTATEEILVNLRLLDGGTRDLTRLPELVETVAAALDFDVPPSTPIVGRDAFRTASGVHAAAIEKALQRGLPDLADSVYTAVPSAWVGRQPEIEIGPLSGRSNVAHFLRTRGVPADPDIVARVLAAAKQSDRVLSEQEVFAAMRNGDVR